MHGETACLTTTASLLARGVHGSFARLGVAEVTVKAIRQHLIETGI